MIHVCARVSEQGGRTAYDFAQQGGHQNIVLLLESGRASLIDRVLDGRSDFARPLLDDGVDKSAENLQSRCCCCVC